MEEGEKPRMTLEEYVSFLEEPSSQPFSLPLVNQIVVMHGCIKFKTKKGAVAALMAADLMRPMRSTRQTREAYPCAGISLPEIRADLASLGWQECPVGSVSATAGAPISPPQALICAPPPAAAEHLVSPTTAGSAAAAGGKKKRKLRTRFAESPISGGKKKRTRRRRAAADLAVVALDG